MHPADRNFLLGVALYIGALIAIVVVFGFGWAW